MGKKKKNSNYQIESREQNDMAKRAPEGARYTPGPVQNLTDYEKEYLKENLSFTDIQLGQIINLTRRYPGLTIKNITRIAGWLTSEYNEQLVKDELALDTKQLLDCDCIDIQELSDDELDEYIKTNARTKFEQNPENRFYYLIPCFQEGIIIHRPSRIIHYKVLDINAEEQTLKLYLHDYSNFGKEKMRASPYKDEYLSGIYGVINIQLEPPDEDAIDDLYKQSYSVEVEEACEFPVLYRIYAPRRLGWDEMYEKIWQRFVIQNSDNVHKKQNDGNISPLVNLTVLFITEMVAANCIMAEKRVKVVDSAPNQESKPNDTRTTKPAASTERKPPERLVRHVGRVKIISRNKPHRATKSTIRKYYVTEWTRRGHIRHLASGKTTYIKPSVFHRKTNKTGTVKQTAPTTIKIHNETEVT